METNLEKNLPNIDERILKIAFDLKNADLKKTGKNTYVGYEYYELSDIQPTIIDLMLKYGVGARYEITQDQAKLILINLDNPEDKAETVMPFTKSNLKNAQDMQNIGASVTYVRRYLLLLAFSISEPEQLDSVQGKYEYLKDKIKKALDYAVNNSYMSYADVPLNFPNASYNKIDKLNYNSLQNLYEEIREYINKKKGAND